MRIARNSPLLINEPGGPNGRRHGRVRCVNLQCQLVDYDDMPAEVLDISASGMRICTRKMIRILPGGVIHISLTCLAGSTDFLMKVVWARRVNFRRFELGATFGEPDEKFRRNLSMIMQAAYDNYIVYDKNMMNNR